MPISIHKHRRLYLAVSTPILMAVNVNPAQAQDQDISAPAIEEVLVLGRLKSSAQSIIDERMDQPFAADLLGSEQISRAGDSDVASALLRVTGVTLIEDQYVYVRSLGERYSSTQLNGAAVPSPELTRNVLPLDVIPTAIVDSLKIQKAWSPDLPAAFGGGNIDIRTKSVPEDLLFQLTIGAGTHSESSDGALFHQGDDRGMPGAISDALYLNAGGSLTTEQIRDRRNVSAAEAEQINRGLALSLDRDIDIQEKSLPLDYSLGLDLGNSWDLTNDLTLGLVLSAARDDESRNKDYKEQGIGAPDRNFSATRRSVDEIKELGSINAGLTYQDDHEIALNSYLIRNTESEAMIQTGNNSSFEAGSGEEFVNYDTRYEQRELLVLQALGEHTFDQLSGDFLGDIRVDWFSSDAEATTDIPHQVRVQGAREINLTNGEEISRSVLSATSAATFAFLEMEDNVRSRGLNVHLPVNMGKAEITFSSGYNYNDKSREYYGYTANINAAGVTGDVLTGTPGTVLSSGNIRNLDNNFSFSMGSGLGTESYIAGQITEAGYGMMDLTWDYRWRLTAGARYENFRQALMPLDLLDYSYVQKRIDELQFESQSLALKEDDWYPSLALTYMNEGFMGTDNFQVRLSASQTVVRPDLREKSEVSFINEDRIRVFGNTSLISSQIDHFDLRTEWFYSSGDNFTVSLFYKDLLDPIEQSRRPGSDNNIELTFYNAESGEIYGVELEGLKDIGAGFFLSSNVTLSKSEIVSPAGEGYANIKRSMTGHSEYVVNAQLGYDSDNGMHSVSTVFNIFGERGYYAARSDGHDDAFEQPFASLDLVYSFYPTSNITTKLKATNLLNENRTYEQVNSDDKKVTILEREVGTGLSIEFAYSF